MVRSWCATPDQGGTCLAAEQGCLVIRRLRSVRLGDHESTWAFEASDNRRSAVHPTYSAFAVRFACSRALGAQHEGNQQIAWQGDARNRFESTMVRVRPKAERENQLNRRNDQRRLSRHYQTGGGAFR